MTLSLLLLGPFLAHWHPDRPISLTSRKAQALLAYLAVEAARPHYREALAGLLWPDYAESSARDSLRHALQDLRRATADDPSSARLLRLGHGIIQFAPEADCWLDVAAFVKGTASLSHRSSRTTLPASLEELQSAVALYRGPFMEGFSLADSPAFEEWLVLKREQCHRQMLVALATLASMYEERRVYDKALACAQRILALEPLEEEAHQRAMRLLALMGRRSEALLQYRHCQEIMMRELGIGPEAETTAVYNSIRTSLAAQLPPAPPPLAPGEKVAERPREVAESVTPVLVAREEQLANLDRHLARALTGEGRVILVTGEPGSGKTALIEEFARQAMAGHEGLLVTIGRCSAYNGAGDAFQPFREALRLLIGDPQGALSPRHARRLQGALSTTLEAMVQHGPDLVRLLARDPALVVRARACAPRGASWLSRLEALAAQADERRVAGVQQAALCEQVGRVLRAMAQQQPVLLLIDDVQWADGPSLDMLFHLGRQLQECRTLIICAYRASELSLSPSLQPHPLATLADEFQRLWGDIRIDLAQTEPRHFVDAYLDSWPNRLTGGFRQTLARHTGGNALFTVELVRAMQERGDLVRDGQGRWTEGPNLAWDKVPPRVEGAISYRIERLTPAQRELLEVAAIEGEQFHAEVLAHVLGLAVPSVLASLSGPLGQQTRIVAPRGLMPVGARELACYRFRHGLFQSYLYNRLDPALRAQLHGAVGAAIEALYAEQAQMLSSQLARHHEEAGQTLKTAHYRLESGRWAMLLGACDEAITHLQRGLALLEDAPPSPERLRLELGLWTAMVNPVLLRWGWQAPALRRALERLADLTQHPDLQDDPQRQAALTVLALTSTWSADPQPGRRVGEQLLSLAHAQDGPEALEGASEQRQRGDQLSLMLGYWVLGHSDWLEGQFVAAREHLERTLALHLPGASDLLISVMGIDPSAMGRALLGSVLWLLGYADQGRAAFQQALAQAQALEQPPTAAFVHLMVAMMHLLLGRDAAVAQSHAAAMRLLGQSGLFYSGFVDVLDRQAPAGQAPTAASSPAHPGQGSAGPAVPAMGSGVGQAAVLLVQAGALARAGQVEIARQAIERALAWIEQTHVQVLEAEVWRVRGELLLLAEKPDRPDEVGGSAEAWFDRALEIARGQQARWLELRTAVSLARLWQRQGRRDEARELLSGIYGWFTEGFDTPDLVEARALLRELGVPLPTA